MKKHPLLLKPLKHNQNKTVLHRLVEELKIDELVGLLEVETSRFEYITFENIACSLCIFVGNVSSAAIKNSMFKLVNNEHEILLKHDAIFAIRNGEKHNILIKNVSLFDVEDFIMYQSIDLTHMKRQEQSFYTNISKIMLEGTFCDHMYRHNNLLNMDSFPFLFNDLKLSHYNTTLNKQQILSISNIYLGYFQRRNFKSLVICSLLCSQLPKNCQYKLTNNNYTIQFAYDTILILRTGIEHKIWIQNESLFNTKDYIEYKIINLGHSKYDNEYYVNLSLSTLKRNASIYIQEILTKKEFVRQHSAPYADTSQYEYNLVDIKGYNGINSFTFGKIQKIKTKPIATNGEFRYGCSQWGGKLHDRPFLVYKVSDKDGFFIPTHIRFENTIGAGCTKAMTLSIKTNVSAAPQIIQQIHTNRYLNITYQWVRFPIEQFIPFDSSVVFRFDITARHCETYDDRYYDVSFNTIDVFGRQISESNV
eukprot:420541_1